MCVGTVFAVLRLGAPAALDDRVSDPLPGRAAPETAETGAPSTRIVQESVDPPNVTHREPKLPAREGAAGSEAVVVDLDALVTRLLHGEMSVGDCLARSGSTAEVASNRSIHRWVDDAGVIHFSDQAPEAGAREHRQIEVTDAPAVQIDARGYDVNLPDGLQQQALIDTLAIERILREALEVGVEGNLGLKIEFIAADQAWAERAGPMATQGSIGSYSSADRTIRVRYQGDDATHFAVLRHEITHALIHEWIGRLPIALNEGLASFFEHVRASGMGAQVALGRQPVEAEAVDADDLVDLLAREGALFYGEGQIQRYQRALALVAVLMSDTTGRRALAAVLARQRAQPCQPVAAEVILDREYPGGLRALSDAWAAWLRQPPDRVHAF